MQNSLSSGLKTIMYTLNKLEKSKFLGEKNWYTPYICIRFGWTGEGEVIFHIFLFSSYLCNNLGIFNHLRFVSWFFHWIVSRQRMQRCICIFSSNSIFVSQLVIISQWCVFMQNILSNIISINSKIRNWNVGFCFILEIQLDYLIRVSWSK